MKIITATAAKNITTNFANNGTGTIIKDIMDNIFYQAMRGERHYNVTIPINKMPHDILKSMITFFRELEYEVSEDYSLNGSWHFTIKW